MISVSPFASPSPAKLMLRPPAEIVTVSQVLPLLFVASARSFPPPLARIRIEALPLAVLLTVVSFSLINNTVRLGIFARRFSINTMKLVGASWSFIRKPFISMAVVEGLLAGIIADAVLAGCVYALFSYEPGTMTVVTWEVLAITGGAVLLFGVLISTACVYFSVNHYLTMPAKRLYKV